MDKRYPILVRDSHGLQLYCADWSLSHNDYEAKMKMDNHYYKEKFEYLGLLTSDVRLIQYNGLKPSLFKKLKWFIFSIKRAFKANIIVGQEYDIHTDL